MLANYFLSFRPIKGKKDTGTSFTMFLIKLQSFWQIGKIWQQKNINEHYVLELQNKLGISDLLAKILSSRVGSVELASSFLSSKIKYIGEWHFFCYE